MEERATVERREERTEYIMRRAARGGR